MEKILETKTEIVEEKKQPETDNKKETNNNVLKKSEIGNQTSKELEKMKNELLNLKKSFVKSLAEKYEINSDINLDKLNYESIDSLEHSLLKYCEDSNIKYKVLKPETEIDKQIKKTYKKIYF